MKKYIAFVAVLAAVLIIILPQTAVCAEMPDTYIDVDIESQTLNYIEDGQIKLTSAVVTGKPGNSTPKGTFAINTCVKGKYLNGPTWHVWVDRWMRFSGNCGLHDATWRKEFGGDIYKTNGSHGCVNLPHDMAVKLYDMVGIGTTVVVH